MDVNLKGVFFCAQAFGRHMIERGQGGRIINIGSIVGVVGMAEHSAYSSSKAGVTMLTRVLAIEWGRYNVLVNAVGPTVILTPLGEKVWGDPVKGDPHEGQDTPGPLRSTFRGGGRRGLPGFRRSKPDHRRHHHGGWRIHRPVSGPRPQPQAEATKAVRAGRWIGCPDGAPAREGRCRLSGGYTA
jgi:NAD(P)-dependent dehydrogenase (short-subunit alcohol dehydrogenase family)